jgi:hypothetical protein
VIVSNVPRSKPAAAVSSGVRGYGSSLGDLALGLGDVQGCGDNPCTWFDYVWVSDACSSYLSCTGQPAMTISGQLGAGVQDIMSGAGSVVSQGVAGAAEGVTSNVTTDIVLAVAAGLAVLLLAGGKL